jgi:aspartyl-tRNA(Asn)/glutamyl-tRNA(Gln) amidotransferase subunit C
MTDQITKELFDHLVRLAALELDAQESEYLRGQLNNQLKAIHELELTPVDPGTPIAAHGVPYTAANSQPARPDRWLPDPDPQRILDQAPEVDERYIIVPEIPHTDLD